MNQAEVIWTLLIVVATLAILGEECGRASPGPAGDRRACTRVVPGLPPVQLDPDLVFLFLFPPLIWPAAVFTSWRDLRANLNSILFLAIGLVLLRTAFVAVVTHALTGLPWPAAFVLGAIISPTDAVAATALVACRFGIAAMMGGTFFTS
jgi:hypothetical protein